MKTLKLSNKYPSRKPRRRLPEKVVYEPSLYELYGREHWADGFTNRTHPDAPPVTVWECWCTSRVRPFHLCCSRCGHRVWGQVTPKWSRLCCDCTHVACDGALDLDALTSQHWHHAFVAKDERVFDTLPGRWTRHSQCVSAGPNPYWNTQPRPLLVTLLNEDQPAFTYSILDP